VNNLIHTYYFVTTMNKQLNYEYGLQEYDTIWLGTYRSELKKCHREQGGECRANMKGFSKVMFFNTAGRISGHGVVYCLETFLARVSLRK
jgi:hypothetical protein